jgi:glycosyltransferase involved in cell wall biosynthesis
MPAKVAPVRTGLRVCVDARVEPSVVGGVAGVIAGLAHGLSSLSDGDEEYLYLVPRDGGEWLEPYVAANGSLLRGSEPARSVSGRTVAAKHLVVRKAPGLRRAWRAASRFRSVSASSVPRSDGAVEAAGVEVVHFVAQSAFLTDLPSIYHPHDLQHVHFPENFTPFERRSRDVEYGVFCRRAALVAVASSWVRDDVIGHFALPPEKVAVVPWAPPSLAYERATPERLAEIRARLRLPRRFLLYPAQAWPHKNHVRLLRALARLRDENGVRADLVCTGGTSAYAAEILRQRRTLRLDEQVLWLGYTSPSDLRALFESCDGVVVPTLFEAASGPVWEAFAAGAAVACSAVTSLPEQAGDAALLFDPRDERSIAEAVGRLWSDDDLRRELGRRGRERVRPFTWERTARHFRALYRRLAAHSLSEEDLALVEAPPLL